MRNPILTIPASFLWFALAALIFTVAASSPSTLAVEKGKSTATSTASPTATETPTITPTDSLNVFETPNTPTPDPQRIYISEPPDGSVVHGLVNLMGKTSAMGFSSYVVEFAYNTNPTDTWFLINRSEQPVQEGVLAAWDTTELTDGDYLLRVRVYFTDGSQRDTFVKGILVRNYTATQTSIPTSTPKDAPTNLPTRSVTQTTTPQATPTPLLPNLAAVSTNQIWYALGRGAVVTIILLIIFGWLIRIRNKNL